MKKPQLQRNVANLTDKRYLSGIQGVTSNAQPTVSRGGGIGVMGSISAAF